MSEIVHQLYVSASCEEVYGALTAEQGLQGWCSADCRFDCADAMVAELGFHEHSVILRFVLAHAEPASRVEWLCASGPSEWRDSRLVFELTAVGAKASSVLFRHAGGDEAEQRYRHLNAYWSAALVRLKSLSEGRALGPLHPGLSV